MTRTTTKTVTIPTGMTRNQFDQWLDSPTVFDDEFTWMPEEQDICDYEDGIDTLLTLVAR